MTPLDPSCSLGLASAVPMIRNLSRLITAIAAVLLAHGAVGQPTPSYRNSIVAEVNDKIITRQMVTDNMELEATPVSYTHLTLPTIYSV